MKWHWQALSLGIGSAFVFFGLILAFGDARAAEAELAAKVDLVDSKLGKSRGCRDSLTELARETPGWVSVDPSDPQVIIEGTVHHSKMADVDFPFSHDSHDFNWHVDPDPQYQNRMSDANEVKNGRRLMEMEWESRYFPTFFWLVAGDRVFVRGRWIFDCGHPPYYTELHPVTLSVATRYKPYQFADQNNPSHANMTYIYAGGQGGYYTQKVLGQDYSFNIPVPPKPSPNATLVTQVVSTSHAGAAPIMTPVTVDGKQMVQVKLPLSRIPDNTPRWWLHDWILAAQRAIVLQKPIPPKNRPANPPTYSAVLASAWKEPTVSKGFRMIRVTFDDYVVKDDHDTGSGEWNMVIRVNDTFMKLPEKSVDDGDRVKIGQSFTVIVPEDGHVTLGAHGWEDDYDGYFGVGMPPGLFDIGSLNGNESLGQVDVAFAANQNFGAGKAWPITVAKGDYGLNIHIDEIKRFPAGAPNARNYFAAEIKSIRAIDSEAKTAAIPIDITLTLAEGAVKKSVQATVGQTTPLTGVRAVGSAEPGAPNIALGIDTALPTVIQNRGSKLPPKVIARPLRLRKAYAPGTYTEVLTFGVEQSLEFTFTIAPAPPPRTIRPGLIDRIGGNVLTPKTGVKPPPRLAKPPIGGGTRPPNVKPPFEKAKR